MTFKKILTKTFLKEELLLKKKTHNQIANEIGCSQSLITKYCKKYCLGKIQRCDKSRIDLTNRKIGYLTVIKYEYTLRKTIYWLCKCRCGSTKIINGKHLKRKLIKSCGCLQKGRKSPRRKGDFAIPIRYFNSIKIRAPKRKLSFDLTYDYIWCLYLEQAGKCALSGIDIDFPKNHKHDFLITASLDRIDSAIGYEKNNVQWVHKHINKLKQDLHDQEFINICFKVADFQRNKI